MKNPLKRSVSEDFWSEWRGSNSRPPHPKCGALSTALHPDSLFNCGRVSGQICGQKFFAETHGGGKARKREENGDFASFRRSAHEAVTRSQSKRVTVTLHPEYQKRNRFRHNIIAEAVLFVND